jgi:hypothetical protein
MSDATTASSSTATVLEPSSSGSGSSEENYSPSTRIRKKKGLSRISVTTVTRNTTTNENENENINRAIDETAVILTFNTLIEQLLIVGKKYNGIDQSNLNELSKLRLIDNDDDDDGGGGDDNKIKREMNQSDVEQIKSLQNNQRIMISSFKPPDEIKKKIDTRLDKALIDKKVMVNVKAFTIINNVCSEYDLESNGGNYYENMKTQFAPSEIIHVDQLFMDTLCFNRITLELVHIFTYLKNRRNPLYYMICRQKIEMIHKTALHEDSSFTDKYFMPKRVGQYYAIIVNFALSNPRTKPLSFIGRGNDVGNINRKSMS